MVTLPAPQQLRYLLALAEHQHFGRAAAACAVTQSTLSAGLMALERQLDARILDRDGSKRVLFTPLGQDLVVRARDALAALEGLAEAAAAARAPMSGRLRLGVIPTVGPFLLPRLMPALRATFPKLQLFLREDVTDKVREALERVKQMEREVRTLKDRLASGQGVDLAALAREIRGVKVLATQVADADAAALRSAVDGLKERLKSAVIVLASVQAPDKVVLVAGVTADQTARIKAGELVGTVAARIGGRGGGRADFAQAGGTNPAELEAALAAVGEWVEGRLTG